MLATQILATLKFFDLQEIPLTLLEVHKFLLAPPEVILDLTTSRLEIQSKIVIKKNLTYSVSEIALEIENLRRKGDVESFLGYFTLKGSGYLVGKRLKNYGFGIQRERRISRFLPFCKFLPFVRGVAVGGSQAMGQEREGSDIDLLVFVESGFIWTARVFLSLFFQVFGVRRHGQKIANRFCLNHYVSVGKKINADMNLYTAMEYGRLRGEVFKVYTDEFRYVNKNWLNLVFPNFKLYQALFHVPEKVFGVQRFFEKMIVFFWGHKLEKTFESMQIRRIKKEDLILVGHEELSFHHPGKQKKLLVDFYGYLSKLTGPRLEVVVVEEES